MRAKWRDGAVHDVLGQRQHFRRAGLIARLDGRTAGNGMEHPLGLFAQSIASPMELGEFSSDDAQT